MYDPKVARFLQEDTYRGQANDPLSLNLYTYCHNEPIMYTDPTGHAEVGNYIPDKYLTKDQLDERRKNNTANNKNYKGTSIVDYLNSIKVDSSYGNMKELARRYGIKNYTGTEKQNLALMGAMKGYKSSSLQGLGSYGTSTPGAANYIPQNMKNKKTILGSTPSEKVRTAVSYEIGQDTSKGVWDRLNKLDPRSDISANMRARNVDYLKGFDEKLAGYLKSGKHDTDYYDTLAYASDLGLNLKLGRIDWSDDSTYRYLLEKTYDEDYQQVFSAVCSEKVDVAAAVAIIITIGVGGKKVFASNNAEVSKAELIKKNKAQGDAFEQVVKQEISETQNNVVQQITVKTKSGVKTRIDLVGTSTENGAIQLTEAKSSATAPLTPNQGIAFPEIAQTGAIVVGKGKSPFTGGTQIPPTTVKIVRPDK